MDDLSVVNFANRSGDFVYQGDNSFDFEEGLVEAQEVILECFCLHGCEHVPAALFVCEQIHQILHTGEIEAFLNGKKFSVCLCLYFLRVIVEQFLHDKELTAYLVPDLLAVEYYTI